MFVKYSTNSKVIRASKTLNGVQEQTYGLFKRANQELQNLNIDPEGFIYLRNRAISSLELWLFNQKHNFSDWAIEPLCRQNIGNNIK